MSFSYDVFINFRGGDTRNTFVSHLYAALSNVGIHTFIDDKRLRKGEELRPELEWAIEASQISILVLSVYYTESSWCLNELLHIMECRKNYGQFVIPVFFGVDPATVRKQTGSFGDNLNVTARKKEHLLDKWRTALTEVANISGWDSSSFSEGKLVKKIVEDILTKIDVSLLSITEFPIGLDSHVQKLTEIIDYQSSKTCMIGIWGMGGSGKTTTAKAIYNRIHRKFDGRTSFIESVRESCENDSRGIILLQQQLLLDVLQIKTKIQSIASGIAKIKTRLRGQRALVVLDDVTKSEQLKALCGNPKLFGSGSVLIITTRDVRLLNSLSAGHVFTMTEMDDNQSLELFSWHAFRQSSPREDFSELSRNVVAYCGGLPLALEVLGSYLSERTEQEWRSALSKLEKIPNNQVLQKLRISYDGLEDNEEKDIFLDICCFFIGKNRVDVTDILNGCGLHADIGIAVLIERSLVKVKKNNKLQMHDLLRDMGRAIVGESSAKEPAKHSRLWFHKDVLDVLSNNTGTETVEGLILKLQTTSRIRFSTHTFKDMKKLRLLKLDGVDLKGDYGLISKQLRWVDWQRPTFKFMPNEFDQGNIVVFELKYSNVKQVLQETKGLAANSSDYFLPGDNYPSWLAYTCEGPSVIFQVPEDNDCCIVGITLCVIYSSTLENLATECLTSILIINYTKLTIQIYKRDTVMSFNDEDWQGVISNLGVGDNVKTFVAIGHGLNVKEMVVYLIYGQSTAMEVEPILEVEVQLSRDMKIEPSPRVEVQSSPNVKTESSPRVEAQPSPDVKTESSPVVEAQPSPDVKIESSPRVEAQPLPYVNTESSPRVETQTSPDVKMETLPKPNEKIFIRLTKRVGKCLCLNPN